MDSCVGRNGVGDRVVMLKLKEEVGEVGATARTFELPPTRLIAVCLCLMVVIGGATTREQVAGVKGKAIAFEAV